MPSLVEKIIAAHGGLENWKKYTRLTAHLKQGGVLWPLKGHPGQLDVTNVAVGLGDEWASHDPFNAEGKVTRFEPGLVQIKDAHGKVLEELRNPRSSFAGHTLETPWSDPQLAYFAGYTMWTYLTSPFILKRPGVITEEIAPWKENDHEWRRLRVRFPDEIATHSTEQTFYFDDRGLLVRHDYEVDIQGRNAAARYMSDYVTTDGTVMPGKMRIYPRGADNKPLPEPLIVSVDLSDFQFS